MTTSVLPQFYLSSPYPQPVQKSGTFVRIRIVFYGIF